MPPLNLPWKAFGRPVKPVAFALMVTMISTFAVAYAGDAVAIGNTFYSQLVGFFAAVVASTLIVGWVWRSQRLAEFGMLGCFAVWMFRLGVYLTDVHPVGDRYVLAAMYALISGGAYLLEKADPSNPLDPHPPPQPPARP
jgi:hypothetical protein